jgi:hypothetical protein
LTVNSCAWKTSAKRSIEQNSPSANFISTLDVNPSSSSSVVISSVFSVLLAFVLLYLSQ